MAQPEVPETDPMIPLKTAELKKQLQGLVKEIIDTDDYHEEMIDEVLRVVVHLKELKFSPRELRCPISKELMKEPVILETGKTYDRPSIRRWLNEGHRTCPVTQKVLSHRTCAISKRVLLSSVLTPNLLVGEIILQWRQEHGTELSKHVEGEEMIADADRQSLNLLLKKMSSSLSDQKEAAKELHLLTRQASFAALGGEIKDAIPRLLSPLSGGRADTHPDLQEDLIKAVQNISIHNKNNKVLAENPTAINLLIESVQSGTIETRSSAAATLSLLAYNDSQKKMIGKFGAIKPLIDLLEEGHPSAVKDAADAILDLCKSIHENMGRAMTGGAVSVILKKITDGVHVDQLSSILAVLSTHPYTHDFQFWDFVTVPCLFSIIRESTNQICKENCVTILNTICFRDLTSWEVIKEDEKANGTLSSLAESGTEKAKEKATEIIECVLY